MTHVSLCFLHCHLTIPFFKHLRCLWRRFVKQNTTFYVHMLFSRWHVQMWWTNKPLEQSNRWYSKTTMPKMTELALKWCHECYQPMTLKYPVWYYSFQKKLYSRNFLWSLHMWQLCTDLISTVLPKVSQCTSRPLSFSSVVHFSHYPFALGKG
jgi:hypothetical protein